MESVLVVVALVVVVVELLVGAVGLSCVGVELCCVESVGVVGGGCGHGLGLSSVYLDLGLQVPVLV